MSVTVLLFMVSYLRFQSKEYEYVLNLYTLATCHGPYFQCECFLFRILTLVVVVGLDY